MTQPLDRFESAVITLSGNGDVKQRLESAYTEFLEALSDDELPGELVGDFSTLRTRMTSVNPFCNETAVSASVRKMSAEEASACAASVVTMYGSIMKRGPVDQIVDETPEDETRLPPFLVKSVS